MNSNFLTDAASKGAILGVLMLASHVLEQTLILSGSLSTVMIAGLEMLVVAALFVYLVWRFTKRASVAFANEDGGYSYGQGLIYVLTLSVLTGVVVGLGSYVYMHFIIGYETYIEKVVAMYSSLLSSSAIPASMAGVYEQMIDQIQSQPEPSVFGTLWSSLWSYLFWGLIVGLFVAGAAKREPKPFDETDE